MWKLVGYQKFLLSSASYIFWSKRQAITMMLTICRRKFMWKPLKEIAGLTADEGA